MADKSLNDQLRAWKQEHAPKAAPAPKKGAPAPKKKGAAPKVIRRDEAPPPPPKTDAELFADAVKGMPAAIDKFGAAEPPPAPSKPPEDEAALFARFAGPVKKPR